MPLFSYIRKHLVIRVKREAIVLALLVLVSSAAFVNATYGSTHNPRIRIEASTTTDIGVYAEEANFLMGKAGHVAMVLLAAGGTIEIPIDTSWEELDGLLAMRIAGGIGHRWWLYYHHDICPEIPPMTTLILYYGKTEIEATPLAKGLANKIGSTLGIAFYPLWSFDAERGSVFIFTSEPDLTKTIDFINSVVISRFPTAGITSFAHSQIIQENMKNEVYTRASLTVIRDHMDVDKDTNVDEFIPVLLLATVLPNTIKETTDGWLKFSVKESLGLGPETKIEPNPASNYSLIKFDSYLPIEIDENRSTIPDNPLYEFTGKLIYVLKSRNSSRTLDDIVIYFKAFSFEEELKSMPFVTSVFSISNISVTTYTHGIWSFWALNVTYSVQIVNVGSGAALNVTVALPLVGDFRRVLNAMAYFFGTSMDEFIRGENWSIKNRTKIGDAYFDAFVTTIDRVEPNSTKTVSFNVILIPDIIKRYFPTLAVGLSFAMGPVVTYKDSEGRDYFVVSNGFIVAPEAAFASVAYLLPSNIELIDPNELLFRFNFKLILGAISGDNPQIDIDKLLNVKAKLLVSRPCSTALISAPKEVASDQLSELTLNETGETVHIFNLSFDANLRFGVWAIFGYVEFTIETPFGNITLGLVTNSYMIYIPPIPQIIAKWLLEKIFPYPHVELEIQKFAEYDATRNELTIRINVKNIGDTDTEIRFFEFLLVDYVDVSAGNNGVISVKINGETVDVHVEVKENLGVIVIVSPWIPIKAGEEVSIEIKVKVVANYTGEIILRPTLFKYNFGRFEPGTVPDEESHVDETEDREEHESEESEHGGKLLLGLPTGEVRALQEAGNILSTFSNSVLIPGAERIRWGIIILLSIIASIIIIVYVKVIRKGKNRS